MNKKGQLVVARFLLFLFILLIFLGFVPMLNIGIADSLLNLNCSSNYSIICLIVDAALPLTGVILLTMLIGYLKRSK